MIIFKDLIFESDELFTDATKLSYNEDIGCYVFDTKQVTVKEGDLDSALFGGNASQEEAAEETEVATITGFDFALANRLKEVEPAIADKKAFQFWAKNYFKQLMEKCKAETPDKESELKQQCTKFVQHFAPKVKDLSFFGAEPHEDSNGEACQGNIVVVEWNDDGVSGKAYCFRPGLKEEKV